MSHVACHRIANSFRPLKVRLYRGHACVLGTSFRRHRCHFRSNSLTINVGRPTQPWPTPNRNPHHIALCFHPRHQNNAPQTHLFSSKQQTSLASHHQHQNQKFPTLPFNGLSSLSPSTLLPSFTASIPPSSPSSKAPLRPPFTPSLSSAGSASASRSAPSPQLPPGANYTQSLTRSGCTSAALCISQLAVRCVVRHPQ